MPIQTVNVIEYADDAIQGIRSFEDTPDGNKEAENVFHDIVKENDPDATEAEINFFIEDGFHEQGDWQLFITHSN